MKHEIINVEATDNIFEAVQTKYNIKEVAENLGIRLHRVGNGFRANSIANDGTGKDAFAIYEQSNSWYDFMLQIGGDITDLVAYVKYDGNKGDALRELMPDFLKKGNFKSQISKYDEFMKTKKLLSEKIFDPNAKSSVNARIYLASRKICDETIKNLQIGLDVIGTSPRLLFPYWDQSGTRITYYTTRRYDAFGKGEDENEPKYKKASLEAHPYLKNSILGLNTVKRDKREVIITEGMFDWLHCYQQGFSALSPNGTDFGKLTPQVIEVIKQHFCEVVLAFDSDEAGQKATYKLAETFLKEQIPFKVVRFPFGKDMAEYCEHDGKIQDLLDKNVRNGKKWFVEYIRPKKNYNDLTIEEREEVVKQYKDFVKTISPYTDVIDMVEILLDLKGYVPNTLVTTLTQQAKKGLKEEEMREIVKEKHDLLYNEKTGFYEFTAQGIWESKDDTEIMGYIDRVYGKNVTGAKLTSGLRLLKSDPDIYSKIPITDFNRLPCIAFTNGTLHFDPRTGKTKFLTHDKCDYVTVRLPYAYDPSATKDNIEKFVNGIMNGDTKKIKLLQEFAGYALLPNCKFQKAILLKGAGSNGKSVFTNIISAALGGIGDGRGYISATEPSKFGKDFRLMSFKNSWLNISSDTENDLRGAEGVFKKIVAGETLEDSYKHKDPFPFQTRTKLMICSNAFPVVNDTTDGFMRRWLIVEFPMHYVQKNKVRKGTNDRPLDPDLEEKLLRNLPGIFNWMLEGLQRLIYQNGFTETDEQDKLLMDFLKANNPLVTFAEDVQEGFFEKNEEDAKELKGKAIYRSEIFNKYRQWAEKHSILPIPAHRFYSNFSSVLSRLSLEFEIMGKQGRIWKFKDVRLSESEPVRAA